MNTLSHSLPEGITLPPEVPKEFRDFFIVEIRNFLIRNDGKYKIIRLEFVSKVAAIHNPRKKPTALYEPEQIIVIGKPQESGLKYTIQPERSKCGLVLTAEDRGSKVDILTTGVQHSLRTLPGGGSKS